MILVIFLIPAAGFYYNKHSCLTSGEVQIVLVNEYSCCAEEANAHCEAESMAEWVAAPGCCTAEKEILPASDRLPDLPLYKDMEADCCSNDGKYLKSQEDYHFPDRVKVPHVEISYAFASLILHPVGEGGSFIVKNTRPPPLSVSSRNMLLRNGVMLI